MERTPKKIDDILRERLYDAAPPPPAFVWDNVERELRKRNNRKLFFWLFSVGIACAGVLGLWLVNETGLEQSAVNIESKQDIQPTAEKTTASADENVLSNPNSPTAAAPASIEEPVDQTKKRASISVYKGAKTSEFTPPDVLLPWSRPKIRKRLHPRPWRPNPKKLILWLGNPKRAFHLPCCPNTKSGPCCASKASR